jgi:hypothetical protein
MAELNSQVQVVANAAGTITIEVETSCGSVALTYSPAAVEAGVSALAKDILRRFDQGNPQSPEVSSLELPVQVVAEAAKVYEERGRLEFPLDAIEKFSPSSKAYARGTVEQFLDSLAPGISLLMDYLAAVLLVTKVSESTAPQDDNLSRSHDATIDLLENRLGASIQRLAMDQRANKTGT